METGRATGPQKRPKHEVEEPEVSGTDEHSTVTEGARRSAAWDELVSRIHDEAQRVVHAVELLPASERVSEAECLPISEGHTIELQLTKLRVTLEQLRAVLP